MLRDEAEEIIRTMRAVGADLRQVEAKRAKGELPDKLWTSVSAFANSPGGGVVMLGVDEKSGFEITGVNNAGKLQQDLAAVFANMHPKIQGSIDVLSLDGKHVVVAEVPEAPAEMKPCYYVPAGEENGSYIRNGDGDRKLTRYEIDLLKSYRKQPTHDEQPVAAATLQDLDADLLRAFCVRVRRRRKRLHGHSDDQILKRFKVLVPEAAVREADPLHEPPAPRFVPSLAGLLVFGRDPQAFYPQLSATVLVLPGTEKGDAGSTGKRYLDNVRAEGTISDIAEEVLQVLDRHLAHAGVVRGLGRADQPEYPSEALREAIVNALAHRDLSPDATGTAVQVELYQNRLLITNPGGLYGPISIETLGVAGQSSARNRALMQILEEAPIPGTDHAIAEHRGFGMLTMIRELRNADMSPPIFEDDVSTFRVTFPRHSLVDPETITWLRGLGAESLSRDQRSALAMMRNGIPMSNSRYRQISDTDSRVATRALGELVDRGWVVMNGTSRWARYTLSGALSTSAPADQGSAPGADGPHHPGATVHTERDAAILALLRSEGPLSRSEIQGRLGGSQPTLSRALKRLRVTGQIRATEERIRSRDVTYAAVERPAGAQTDSGDQPGEQAG